MPVGFFCFFLYNVWAGSKVSAARKQFGVPYPTLYAVPGTPRVYGPKESYEASYLELPELISDEDAFRFNCIQRGHQNTLESASPVIALALVSWGLPIIAGFAFLLWVVSRFLYLLAYSRGPEGRSAALPYYLPSIIVLLGTTIATAVLFFIGKAPC